MEKCKTCEYYIENEPNGLTGMCKYCRDGENYKRKIDTMKDSKESIIEKAVELYTDELKQMRILLEMIKTGAGEIIDIEKSVSKFKKHLIENK